MRRSRFSEEKTVAVLRKAERSNAAETARGHKFSEPC